MASVKVSSRDDGSTQIDMNKCKSCQLCNTRHSSTEETASCKKRLGDAFSKQQAIERQTSDDSMFAESNMFMLKAIILWAIICLPGNIFAFGKNGTSSFLGHELCLDETDTVNSA